MMKWELCYTAGGTVNYCRKQSISMQLGLKNSHSCKLATPAFRNSPQSYSYMSTKKKQVQERVTWYYLSQPQTDVISKPWCIHETPLKQLKFIDQKYMF